MPCFKDEKLDEEIDGDIESSSGRRSRDLAGTGGPQQAWTSQKAIQTFCFVCTLSGF